MPSRASRSTPSPSRPRRARLPLRQPPPSPRSTTITSRGPRRIAGGGPCSLASSSRSVGTCIPCHADASCWRGRRSTPNLGEPPPAGVHVRQKGGVLPDRHRGTFAARAHLITKQPARTRDYAKLAGVPPIANPSPSRWPGSERNVRLGVLGKVLGPMVHRVSRLTLARGGGR